MGLRNLFSNYDKQKRRSHFKNLFALAQVDGEVSRAEMDLVVGLAEKFHMSTKEVTKIIRDPSAVPLVRVKTPEERLENLYDLITVMLVDGRTDERELFLCKSLGVKLGCDADTIDSLVRELMEMSENGISPEAAVERLKGTYC